MKAQFRRGLLVAAAIMAVGVVAAPAASATGFGVESSPTFFKGEQETKNVFTVSGGTAKCSEADLTSGEVSGTSFSSLTVHPVFSVCSAFGGTADLETGGCNYVLTASSTVTGNLVIECETGKEIVINDTAAKCKVYIPAQTPSTNMVSYTDEGSGSTEGILVTWELEGITYTASGGICGLSGSNGVLTGSIFLKGYGTSSFTFEHAAFTP